jgi:RHS repeat-associated protein
MFGVYPASQTYDVENRVSSAGQYNIPQVLYAYDSGNRRAWKGSVNTSGVITAQEMYYYGANGKKLGTYVAIFNPPGMSSGWNATDLQVHFGGRSVAHWAWGTLGLTVQLRSTFLDRVGSVRNAGSSLASSSFYPYGEDKGTAAPNDQTKFATYTRDSATGLDYAMNRYFSNTWGRFTTTDPTFASAEPSDPQSWNRYPYAGNDPISNNDPSGLLDFCDPFDPVDGGDDCSFFPPPPPILPPIGGGPGGTIGPITCTDPRSITTFAADLGATSTLPGGCGAINGVAQLEIPLANWNAFAASSGFLPQLAGAGAAGGVWGVGEVVFAGSDWLYGVVLVAGSPYVILTVGTVAVAAVLYTVYAKGRQGDAAPTNIVQQMNNLMWKLKITACQALEIMMREAKGDVKKQRQIRTAQKQYGCSGPPR